MYRLNQKKCERAGKQNDHIERNAPPLPPDNRVARPIHKLNKLHSPAVAVQLVAAGQSRANYAQKGIALSKSRPDVCARTRSQVAPALGRRFYVAPDFSL